MGASAAGGMGLALWHLLQWYYEAGAASVGDGVGMLAPKLLSAAVPSASPASPSCFDWSPIWVIVGLNVVMAKSAKRQNTTSQVGSISHLLKHHGL